VRRSKKRKFQLTDEHCKMTVHQHSNILIVDDSATVRSIVRKLLTELGFKNIDEASDGATALTKISKQHVDLVISDWNMEPMNGEKLLRQVRSNEMHKKLPFIMMTADSTINKIIEAKHSGVSCYIIKPFGAEGLQAKILEINKKC
jgi:two-component system, chemotaxis family, chemotaxis protein CheY